MNEFPLQPVTVGDVSGWDFSNWFTVSNPGIQPSDMSAGAASWDQVFKFGISRAFDVAGKVYVANNLPYYQTPAGQQTSQWAAASQATGRLMMIMLIGAIAVVMLRRGG